MVVDTDEPGGGLLVDGRIELLEYMFANNGHRFEKEHLRQSFQLSSFSASFVCCVLDNKLFFNFIDTQTTEFFTPEKKLS